MKTKQSRNSLY